MRREGTQRKSTAELHKVNFFVDRGLFDTFREISDAADRNVSQELRRLMRERVKEHEAEQEPAA